MPIPTGWNGNCGDREYRIFQQPGFCGDREYRSPRGRFRYKEPPLFDREAKSMAYAC